MRKREFFSARMPQLADPYIAEPDGIAVVLQGNGLFDWMRFVRSPFEPTGGAGELNVVLNQHAVVKHGHPCRGAQLPVRLETGCGVNDVINLPFTRRTAGVDQGRYWP